MKYSLEIDSDRIADLTVKKLAGDSDNLEVAKMLHDAIRTGMDSSMANEKHSHSEYVEAIIAEYMSKEFVDVLKVMFGKQ